jgi:hypothetical protein
MMSPNPPGLGRVRRKLWDQVITAYPRRKRLPVPSVIVANDNDGARCLAQPRTATPSECTMPPPTTGAVDSPAADSWIDTRLPAEAGLCGQERTVEETHR